MCRHSLHSRVRRVDPCCNLPGTARPHWLPKRLIGPANLLAPIKGALNYGECTMIGPQLAFTGTSALQLWIIEGSCENVVVAENSNPEFLDSTDIRGAEAAGRGKSAQLRLLMVRRVRRVMSPASYSMDCATRRSTSSWSFAAGKELREPPFRDPRLFLY